MDTDSTKGYKSKIIKIFGKEYEITHKNNNVINNKYSIFFGWCIFICKKFFINSVLFRKCLILLGIFTLGYIIIWSHIDISIMDCINNNNMCVYNITDCINIDYNKQYKCIRELHNINLINSSIYNFINIIYNLCKIILLLYFFTIICDKLSLIINMSIKLYTEQIPNIDSII